MQTSPEPRSTHTYNIIMILDKFTLNSHTVISDDVNDDSSSIIYLPLQTFLKLLTPPTTSGGTIIDYNYIVDLVICVFKFSRISDFETFREV